MLCCIAIAGVAAECCGCVGCGLLHTFWTFGAFNGNSAQLDNVAYTCKRVARYALPNTEASRRRAWRRAVTLVKTTSARKRALAVVDAIGSAQSAKQR